MRTNRPTILRFYGDEVGEIPAVTPTELQAATSEITTSFQMMLQHVGIHGAASLVFATSPRSECLAIYFQPVIDISFAMEVAPSILVGADGIPVLDLEDLAGVGLFLWQIMFGDRGLIDLFRRGEMPSGQNTSGESLTVEVAGRALATLNVASALQSLLNNPSLHKWRRVTISVSDTEVALYDDGERRVSSVLGRRRFSDSHLGHVWDGTDDLAIVRTEHDTVEVLYQGQKATVFTASTVSKSELVPALRILVLWTSGAAIPTFGSHATVRGRTMERFELSEVVPQTPYPGSFEIADAIFLVTGVRTYL